MTSRLTLIGVFALLAGSACQGTRHGYYWWDQTNDVWCYTYSNGDTECDTPSGHTGADGAPGYSGGDNDTGGDSTLTRGDATPGDTGPGDDGTGTGSDDGTRGSAGNTGSGAGADGGTSPAAGGDTGGGATTIPPSPVCEDASNGKRYCIVTDGDHICEFVYDADGNITGACGQTGSNPIDHHGCSESDQGGLICEFETDAGDQCIVVFDKTGVVEFDPCHYFQSTEPTN